MSILQSEPAMPRPASARLVRDYFTRAEAAAIHRVPPSYLAARLCIDGRTALGMLAEAMLEGIVELNWEIRCPMCDADGPYSLGHAHHAETCPSCSAHFEVGLDHSGTTVNIAARIKDLARPGQVVMTEAMRDPQSDTLLADRRVEPAVARVRGLDHAVDIYTFTA